MEQVAPAGPVYQAGTLSGNPLAMAGGIATLSTLTPALHSRIETKTATLVEGLQKIGDDLGVPLSTGCAGSMWGFFFSEKPVRNFMAAKASDTKLFSRFFHAALSRGVYLAPSPFEACFMSAAHGDAEIDYALTSLREAMEDAIDD
jgi:glutamate-1-semialdehyde 2,1-aminomutase